MKRCLVVIDYQNDFVSGSLGFDGAVKIESSIIEKILLYRQNLDTIIFTFDTHDENYLKTQEGNKLPVLHCVKGTEGHSLYGQIADLVVEGDICFEKGTFGSDMLYEHLKKNPYESIELVGVVSNICVISNAVLAKTAQPETPVIVDAGCTASNDENLNTSALDVMTSLQVIVTNR